MKQIKNIRNFLLISLIAGGTWIGCDDANYSTLDTHVFFEEALTATSTKVTVMGSGETNVTLNAHISNTQQKDNSYSLAIDQAALDAYNKANGTNYIALPETPPEPAWFLKPDTALLRNNDPFYIIMQILFPYISKHSPRK